MSRGLALVALTSALLSLSCAKVLGVAENRQEVAERMCGCSAELGFIEGDCATYIDKQLAAAPDDVLATWLEAYDPACSTCDKVLDCYYREPICKTRGCSDDWQCCSAAKGGKCQDGLCTD